MYDSFIIWVVSRDMFTSLKKGLVDCLKLREGAHGFIKGTRFLRGPNVELVSHSYALGLIVELHYISELYIVYVCLWLLSWEWEHIVKCCMQLSVGHVCIDTLTCNFCITYFINVTSHRFFVVVYDPPWSIDKQVVE